MLVFFVLLCFAAEGFCSGEETSIAKPRLCQKNEIPVKCRTICPPQSCNISYTDFVCGPETKKCESGCDCIKNNLRDDDGNCIPNNECPPPKPKCGKNQVQSDCADNYSANPKITLCQPGCRCDEGFERDTRDECVPRSPVLKCPKNEEPCTCKQTCPPEDCSWDPKKMACKPGPCQPGCNCIEGYKRDKKGNCIPKEKCPPIPPECGKNEEPTDCAKNIGPYDSTLTIKCSPCRCIPGYVRDSNGACVPRPVKCKENQVKNSCPPPCFSENCGDKEVVPKVCNTFAPHVCQPRCVCRDNYRRDIYGNCIPIGECPPQCGKYEEQTDCSDNYPQLRNAEDTSVSSARIRCIPGCKCIVGYQRNNKGVCVKIPPQCGKNEEPTDCARNIGSYDSSLIRCRPCQCIPGYVRDSNGACVPLPPQCGKNEEPTDCARNIGSYDSSLIKCRPCQCIPGYVRDSNGACVPCPPQCGKNEEPTDCARNIGSYDSSLIKCSPCQCIPGYVRDSSDACVPRIQCGENEELSECKKECPPDTCAWDPVLMDCKPVSCKRGCNCIEGYLRDDNGKCIPQKQCRTLQCGKHEEETDCSDNYPLLRNVEDTSVSSARIRCFPGCKCIVGYQRDSQGVCVKIPRCGQNETYVPCDAGCPTQYCPENDSLAKVACSQPFPCRGGCACKRNYKYRSYTDKSCILARECRPIKCTRDDEEYNPCPSACFTDECGELDEETAACNTFVEAQCEPRCMCRPTYRRDSSGKCIPKEKCPININQAQ